MQPLPVEKIIAGPNLPTLPAVAMRVLELTQNDDVDLTDLATAIQADQALSARILRTINSSFYGLPRPVGSIRPAIQYLGTNAVKALVLGFSLVQSINGRAEHDVGFNYVDYWRRAVHSAAAARELARASRKADHEEAFLAALMQDIGMIALYRAYGDRYLQIMDIAGNDHNQLSAIEQRELEVTHERIGAKIAQIWRLPDSTIEAIASHHGACRDDATNPMFCRIVHLGVMLADVITCNDDEARISAFMTQAEQRLGLSHAALQDIMSRAATAASDIASQLKLKTGETPDIEPILARADELRLQHEMQMARNVDGTPSSDAAHNRTSKHGTAA